MRVLTVVGVRPQFIKAAPVSRVDGRPVEVDGEAGMRALHLALALVKSAAEGRAIGREELAALRSGALRSGD